METTLSDPNENKLSHSSNNFNESSGDSDPNLTPRAVKSLNVFKITGHVPRNIVPISIFKESTHLLYEHNLHKHKQYNYKR